MIGEGIELMIVGMGVVFAFLVLLVILMRVSGALLSKFPEPEILVAPRPTRKAASGDAAAKMAVALAAAHRAAK